MKLEREALFRPHVSAELARPLAVGDWSLSAVVALAAIAWLFAWYAQTALATVAIWWRSDTYAHGFLIFPISAYLIWRRRASLAWLTPTPNFFGLPVLAVLGFAWLLAHLADVIVVQQYALILMLGVMVFTILGSRVTWAVCFPLCFLLFAVPVGEFLVHPLMDFTADFTVGALRLTGIAVYREGNFFSLPTGSWSIVEACSGLRYLIASITLGCLYAYLTYRGAWRRASFIAASVIVPILANGIRAYLIVMIGHLSRMRLATGIDHLIYGWIFFGVVVTLLFWIGSFFREDMAEGDGQVAAPPNGREQVHFQRLIAASVAAAAMVAIGPVYAAYLEGRSEHALPELSTPANAGGWEAHPGALSDWTPHFESPRAVVHQVYWKEGRPVALYIGFYNDQRKGSELITSTNKLVSTVNKVWGSVFEQRREVRAGSSLIPVIEQHLRGADLRLAAWYWYWIEGFETANPYAGKFVQALSKLTRQRDDSAVVILYTPFDERPEAARAALQDFVDKMLPGVHGSLGHAGGR